MSEKKVLMFEELQSTAKTIRQRLALGCCENWNSGSPCDKECDEPLVSLGVVLQLREQTQEKEVALRKLLYKRPKCETCPSLEKGPDGDVSGCSNYVEGEFGFCVPMRKWIKELKKDVFGVGSGDKKALSLSERKEPALRKENEKYASK